MWTSFRDTYSGGNRKLEWEHIIIELSEDMAKSLFMEYFEENPYCGENYNIEEYKTLDEIPLSLSRFETREEYLKRPTVKVIRWDDVPGTVPVKKTRKRKKKQ